MRTFIIQTVLDATFLYLQYEWEIIHTDRRLDHQNMNFLIESARKKLNFCLFREFWQQATPIQIYVGKIANRLKCTQHPIQNFEVQHFFFWYINILTVKTSININHLPVILCLEHFPFRNV